MRFFTLAIAVWITASGQPLPQPAAGARLALHLLGHRIGEERYSVESRGERNVLTAHFEYLDRGTPVALDGTLTFSSKDFTPISFEVHGKSYRYFSVNTSVPAAPKT